MNTLSDLYIIYILYFHTYAYFIVSIQNKGYYRKKKHLLQYIYICI